MNKTIRPGCSNENWQFAEPDYTKVGSLPRIDAQEVKEGDYLMVEGAGRWVTARVTDAVRRDGTLTMIVYQVLHVDGDSWSNLQTTRTAMGITISNSSRKYRAYKPQPKPVPPPVVVVHEITENIPAASSPVDKSATLTALASIDAGIQTLCALVREQNKILCSLTAGVSAIQDTARETQENLKEVLK